MRMVSPNSFGSYAGTAHRKLLMCHGTAAGRLETKSFTASGLTKITLPNGCTAETDTHIFAAADDGFRQSREQVHSRVRVAIRPTDADTGLGHEEV
jgi:hypothetical protein